MTMSRRGLLQLTAALGLGQSFTADAKSTGGHAVKDIEQAVQQLLDRVEINEFMARYCRLADQLDTDGMATCFTDDCVVAYVPPTMAPAFRNKQELLAFLRGYFQTSVSSSHYISNVELVFDKPDQVTGTTYMYSWQRFKDYPAAADCHRFGRYECRLVRTAESWRFSRLLLVSAGEYGGARIGEQFNRPWPPKFD